MAVILIFYLSYFLAKIRRFYPQFPLRNQKIYHTVEAIQKELDQVFKDFQSRGSKASQELERLWEVMTVLLPQIKYFIETGFVANKKIIHLKISELYSIVRGKAGKKTEFGIKWGINRMGGGFVSGFVMESCKHASDIKFCHQAVLEHVKTFWAAPETYGFDRGGYSKGRFVRKRRFPSEDRRGKIQNARPISERPKGANSRRSVGHWERDLMVGKNHKSAVLVVTDRKSRFNKLRKLDGKHAKKVTRETAKALKGLPIKTMSNDRGQEFSDHQNYEKKSKVKVYFCDPYSSYQRGTNENRIGAIRQYLPKKTDLTNLTNKDLEKIEFQINNRPMKCLDWMTPVEFMMEKSCTGKL
jgi:IS30 family transposase